MIEKRIEFASSHEEADRIAREQDNELTCEERFVAFMKLMEPYYEAAEGLQRICRVDDPRKREVHDDWRVRVQFVSKPESDG